ncbi:unnamed protein product [Staurois parvus]|uniref:Uncharacterized protein n=1 Tax=Staurois parvus TaxID=386267 RepID=A0ABN9HWV0_9NEOB|nr:unnamed protein product [Staurois parvus]
MRGSELQSGDRWCPVSLGHRRSTERAKDQCHLLVSINASCQCSSMPPASATSMPHISAYQCTSMPHFSDHLSCLSVSPISAIYQCRLSVLPISASQCRISAIYECCLSVPISDACQCPSVPPTSASSSVPPISAHHCSLISVHQ